MNRKNTLLIVDDDADMRESLRDALGDEGYTIVLASNGREALGLLPGLKRPCGIILDITMPVMSGTEFYEAMRAAAPAFADIPVLVLTSNPSRVPNGLPTVKKSIGLEQLLTMVAGLFWVPLCSGVVGAVNNNGHGIGQAGDHLLERP